MQGIHTLAQPPNSRADTHLQRAEKEQKQIVSKLNQNTNKTQTTNWIEYTFSRLRSLHLAKSTMNCFDRNLQKDLPRFAPRNYFALLCLSSDFPVHTQNNCRNCFCITDANSHKPSRLH